MLTSTLTTLLTVKTEQCLMSLRHNYVTECLLPTMFLRRHDQQA
jgi:hypothetical protein